MKNKIVFICLLLSSVLCFFLSCNLYYDPIPSHSIQISNPYNAAELKVSDYIKISWEYRDVSDFVIIELYDEGLYKQNIDSLAPNINEYIWFPQDYLRHSERYSIKITDALNPDIFKYSDEFIIYKTVVFPDINLHTLINNNLGNIEEITTKELLYISELSANDKNIWHLAGIGNCINIVDLDISDNYFYSIEDLQYLKKMTHLNISNNQNLVSINPINDLIKLEEIDISNINLETLSTVLNLKNIKKLNAAFCGIKNIDALEDITKVEFLNLSNNQVSEISSISTLTQIDVLLLNNNNIVDIYPLVNNSGVDDGDIILLTNNPLNAISKNQYIPQLQNRGVIVSF